MFIVVSLVVFGANRLAAQGAAQVTLIGVPPVLDSPFIADQERDYQLGRYTLQFLYNDPTGASAVFRFHITLEHDGRVVLDAISDPVTFAPGFYIYRTFTGPPAIRFPGGFSSALAAADPAFRAHIEQSGRLPEGQYFLTLEAVPGDENPIIPTVPGSASLTVQYAEPPLLLSPADGDVVDLAIPTFTWTPASGAPPGAIIEYEILIVEMLPGQQPLQAIEANRAHVRKVLTAQTTFVYTAVELPLEEGRQYAWQITARDAAGRYPFTDDGLTEVFTFTYGETGTEVRTWTYPSTNPVFRFELLNAEETPAGLLVNGTLQGTVAGEETEATFEQALFDPVTLKLINGRIVLGTGAVIEGGS